MGRVHRSFLPGTRIYACSNCRAHLTNHEDIVSKSFQGRTGRAYLFNTVVNVTLGPIEDRILTTGLHKVRMLGECEGRCMCLSSSRLACSCRVVWAGVVRAVRACGSATARERPRWHLGQSPALGEGRRAAPAAFWAAHIAATTNAYMPASVRNTGWDACDGCGHGNRVELCFARSDPERHVVVLC